MHKRAMTFEQLLRQGMIHQILANDRFWMARPDVLVQRYEELLADPTRGVIELARHLGIRLDGARRPASPPYTPTNQTRHAPKRCDADCRKPASTWIARPTLRSATPRPSYTGTTSVRANRGHGTRSPTRGSGDARAALRPVAEGTRVSARREEPGKAHGFLRERVRTEVDLVVGYATYLVRATSLRIPANGPGA